jgi:hypothetical protein
MSLQYGFVTPLTSMVVTKPKTEEEQEEPLIADKLTEGMTPSGMGEETTSKSGVSYLTCLSQWL